MKTNKQTKTNKQNNGSTNMESGNSPVSELQNRSEHISRAPESETAAPETETNSEKTTVNAQVKPYVNFAERDFNRKLSVEQVLEKLRRWMPQQYELAEVVGKWVWITFPEPPIERVRAEISQLGFHWNNTRKCWQHPCGETLQRGTQEPREKYQTYFPADQAAA